MGVPVADGLFTWPDERPRLIGSRHPQTGAVSFPAADAGAGEERILLSRTGTLFTWTTQQFVPPAPPYAGETDPESFVPYAVGYVELPEGVLVEGRLTESDPDKLTIGQEMELVVMPFRLAVAAAGNLAGLDRSDLAAQAKVPAVARKVRGSRVAGASRARGRLP
jgi:uncharacterized OB-fold protein